MKPVQGYFPGTGMTYNAKLALAKDGILVGKISDDYRLDLAYARHSQDEVESQTAAVIVGNLINDLRYLK